MISKGQIIDLLTEATEIASQDKDRKWDPAIGALVLAPILMELVNSMWSLEQAIKNHGK